MILGLIFGLSYTFIQIGIWVFAAAVLFQIVTLPVEFNASGRALQMLQSYRILTEEETGYCRKVLSAAALTYVAAAASLFCSFFVCTCWPAGEETATKACLEIWRKLKGLEYV